MRASPVKAPTEKATKRPKKGPFRCKPNGNPTACISPTETRKNGPVSGHTRKGDAHMPACYHDSPGESMGLLASFARMKIIRSHRSGLRGEFSFGITSHKNYYVNSRVQNEETSAFEPD